MTLVKRHINLKFHLSQGSFEGGGDTLELSGLRVSATIARAGGATFTQCDLRVYGLSLDVMRKLTILSKLVTEAAYNTITVSAGDDNSGLAVVFYGTILEGWIDARNAPDVAFIVTAQTGLIDALKPTQPVSYKGSIDAATVISGIAAQANYAFENSGVSVQISSPYLSGTMVNQLRDIATAADINCLIDAPAGVPTVAIWPKDGKRGGQVPLVSPETGMVGYPLLSQNGLDVVMLFNPNILFGGQMNVQSSILKGGEWNVYYVTHDLESETPGGKWFTLAGGSPLGNPYAQK